MDKPEDAVDLRIGDAERESAIGALGEHLSAGRLTIDEYGERSAKVTTARTNRELSDLFRDLPQPRPDPAGMTIELRKSSELASDGPLAPAGSARVPVPVKRGELAPRIVRGLGAATGVAWLILLITGHGQFWWLLFVPALFFVFASQVWPSENDEEKRKKAKKGKKKAKEDARGELT